MSKKIRKFYISIILFISVFSLSYSQKTVPLSSYIYGITVDDSWDGKIKTEQIIEAIKAMSIKPTVRIVMSKDVSPKEYKELFQKYIKLLILWLLPLILMK